jgi:hypothetical protein
VKEWSENVRDGLRALQYWRRITDGVAIVLVVAAGLGVLSWIFNANH